MFTLRPQAKAGPQDTFAKRAHASIEAAWSAHGFHPFPMLHARILGVRYELRQYGLAAEAHSLTLSLTRS